MNKPLSYVSRSIRSAIFSRISGYGDRAWRKGKLDRDHEASLEWGRGAAFERDTGSKVGIETRGGRISTSRELPIAIGGFNLYPPIAHASRDGLQRWNNSLSLFLFLSLSFLSRLPPPLPRFKRACPPIDIYIRAYQPGGKVLQTSYLSFFRIVQSKFQRSGLCKWHRLVLYTKCPLFDLSLFCPASSREIVTYRPVLCEKDRSKGRFFERLKRRCGNNLCAGARACVNNGGW